MNTSVRMEQGGEREMDKGVMKVIAKTEKIYNRWICAPIRDNDSVGARGVARTPSELQNSQSSFR